MGRSADTIDVYLEIGKKRTLAAALDWPGWCRGGRDEASALQALVDYGPRYARVLSRSRLGFKAPTDVDAFVVVERLEGNATTDYGVPDKAPATDTKPIETAEMRYLQSILKASWRAFDAAADMASGKSLRKGPRGGGRETAAIVEHVLGAEQGYIARLGQKIEKQAEQDPDETAKQIHAAALKALAAAAHGELPKRGPRGGVLWVPRYFVRRVAWHVLDHVWEIEDRAV